MGFYVEEAAAELIFNVDQNGNDTSRMQVEQVSALRLEIEMSKVTRAAGRPNDGQPLEETAAKREKAQCHRQSESLRGSDLVQGNLPQAG
jgi:hypothetical protein